MNDERQTLIDGYLDDVLSDDELRRFNELVKSNPEFARQFALASLLHDRLHAEVAILAADEPQQVTLAPRPQRRWVVAVAATTAALVVLGFLTHHEAAVSPASAASTAIDKLIAAAGRQVDRVYRIRITDFGPGDPPPQVPSGAGGRKPNVDGAELYVRGLDQFVLIRRFGNGTLFVTGSDGEIGWAAPPRGHVHLSKDVRRFRRAVPGEHEEIPFLDMKTSLDELRRDYELSLLEPQKGDAAAEKQWSRLDAVKRPRVRGGPERVQIWFDASGVAHRIALNGLPEGEPDGSPRAVELELLEQRLIGPDFFRHESHHEANRPLNWE